MSIRADFHIESKASHPTRRYLHDVPDGDMPEALREIHQRLHDLGQMYVHFGSGDIEFTIAGSPQDIEDWAHRLIAYVRAAVVASSEVVPS